MAQIADIRFDTHKPINPEKPLRISITTKLHFLPLVYTGDYPQATSPKAEARTYVENPAALELARQIYAGLFKKEVTIDDIRSRLCLAHFVSGHKLGDPEPDHANPETWVGYEVAFDHIIPPETEDPEVLTLVAKCKEGGTTIWVGDVSDEFRRQLVNRDVSRMGGVLGEISSDGLYSFRLDR